MLPVGDTAVSLYAWRGDAVVRAVKARAVRWVAASSAQGGRLGLAILIVAGSLPVAWLLHGRRAASEWLLAAVGLTAVSLPHPGFGLALLGLLLLLWALRAGARGASRRGWFLLAGLALTTALLMAFKYGAGGLTAAFASPALFPAALPLGVSYFVIRLVDTQLRWYRGELSDVPLRQYLAFLLFPPTLPAGPLETLDHFRQCRTPRILRADVSNGLSRIALGVLKKVCIADFLLSRVIWRSQPSLFERVVSDPGQASGGDTLLLLFASFLFAYVDFSAYSDIAIGLARLFGYRIVENFDWPVLATDLRDFWRRWHMSLSAWCFRNVYVPLSITTRSSVLPVLAVMLLVGIWHAASASWGAWAVHHFAGLVVLGYFQRRRPVGEPRWPLVRRVASTVATIAFVTAGHAFVLVNDFPTAAQLYFRWWRALLLFP